MDSGQQEDLERKRRLSRSRISKGLVSIIIAVVILTVLVFASIRVEWASHVVNHDFAAYYESAIAVDSGGTLHLVGTFQYNLYTPIDGLIYANNSGGSWRTWATATYPAYNPAIALDSEGWVHIVCSVFNASDSLGSWNLLYITNSGGEWATSVIDSTYYFFDISAPSIALDSSNNVHISYSRGAFGNTSLVELEELVYATNTNGTWVNSTLSAELRDDSIWLTDIAIGPDQKAFVVAKAGDSGWVTLFSELANHTWDESRVQGGAYIVGDRPLLSFDGQGRLRVLYSQLSGTDSWNVTLATASSTKWQYDVIGRGPYMTPVDAAQTDSGLVVLCSNDVDSGKSTVLREDQDGTFHASRVQVAESQKAGRSICVHGSGREYIPVVGNDLGFVTNHLNVSDRLEATGPWSLIGGLVMAVAIAYAVSSLWHRGPRGQ